MAKAHINKPGSSKAALSARAKSFCPKSCLHKSSNHNLTSILFRLTGQRFEPLTEKTQIEKAKLVLEKALLVERRKAKMQRFDYDLNRHIALHQANKKLNDIYNQISQIPHGGGKQIVKGSGNSSVKKKAREITSLFEINKIH